jgi:hypothetical protein
MLSKVKEWWHFRRQVKDLVASCLSVRSSNPELSSKELYREFLLQTTDCDDAEANRILRSAEGGLDEWMNPEDRTLGFRELAHYLVLNHHLKNGHAGTIVALDDIIRSIVPKDL